MKEAHHVLMVAIIFTALAAVFVALRLYTRFAITVKKIGVEDLLVVFALIFSIGQTACIAVQTHHGLGYHVWDVALPDVETLVKAVYASIFCYGVALTLAKNSILVLYLRFFQESIHRYAVWVCLILFNTFTVAALLSIAFACTPISFYWDKAIPNGKCINLTAIYVTSAAWHIATDITLILLPIPVLRTLTISTGKRNGLMIAFALGGFGCITSILRLRGLVLAGRTVDFTRETVTATTWSAIECNTGIICACLPALRPLAIQIYGFLRPGRMAAAPAGLPKWDENTARNQQSDFSQHPTLVGRTQLIDMSMLSDSRNNSVKKDHEPVVTFKSVSSGSTTSEARTVV